MKPIRILTLLSALSVPTLMHADALSFLITAHTGAQTQIDLDHDTVFIAPSLDPTFACPVANCSIIDISAFDAAADWFLGGGQFTMKDGTSTSADITFSLYDSGTLVDFVSLTRSAFCTDHGGNCQSFSTTELDLSPTTGYAIQQNHHYTAILSSNAVDAQNEAYFIKGNGTALLTPAPPGYTPPDGPLDVADVPEPASVVTFAGGGLLLLLSRFRRSAR